MDDDARVHVDFLMLALKANFSVPDGWEIYAWELKNFGTKFEYIELSGAVVSEVFKSGKRKGRKNWAKKNRSDEMKFPLRHAEIDAAKDRWSAETGRCHHCTGNGTAWKGWSAAEGNRYEPCSRCSGTGSRPTP